MNDFFADVRDLTDRSPLKGKGDFTLNLRYSLSDDGVLFELVFLPLGSRPRITAKWIIDLLKMSEEGATHRELVQKGLDAIQEAFVLRGY